MAATKGAVSILSAVTTTQTSAAIDCSTYEIQQIFANIVVAGTPTGAAAIQPQYSVDGGTTYYNGFTYKTDLAAGTYPFIIDVPPTTNRLKLVFTQQTGGTSSTLTAQLGTAITA
jgi:hypothetical protein